MIPVNEKEGLPHKDESGVTLYILPLVGDKEYELHRKLDEIRECGDPDKYYNMKNTDELFDMFVVGWDEGVPFPEDKKPSKKFKQAFKSKIVFDIILKDFNKVTVEEKKS